MCRVFRCKYNEIIGYCVDDVYDYKFFSEDGEYITYACLDHIDIASKHSIKCCKCNKILGYFSKWVRKKDRKYVKNNKSNDLIYCFKCHKKYNPKEYPGWIAGL